MNWITEMCFRFVTMVRGVVSACSFAIILYYFFVFASSLLSGMGG